MKLKTCLALLAAMGCLLMIAFASAEDDPYEWPALNAEGFLDEGEFVYEGADIGLWRYVSPTLKVEIVRKEETDPKKLIWYEAEIFTRGEERWQLVTAEPGRHMTYGAWPYLVAQRNNTVFGINNDYSQGRLSLKNRATGLIIREGRIIWAKTRTVVSKAFPPLDVMAFMPDGSLEVFDFNEHTAQDYLDMGVEDIQCFGPWLIRDGKLNTDGVKRVGTTRNPRTAIGMIENGHYIAMVVEGRYKQSAGVTLAKLAEMMQDCGCVTAFNLDGGTTSAMVFMGRQINKVGGSKNAYGSARRVTELIAVGTSAQVYQGKPGGK